MRIRLADADRERLGLADEWLTLDLDSLMQSEAEELEKAGIDPDRYRVPVPVKDPVTGEPLLDGDAKPVVRLPMRSWRAIVWLALRRAGVHKDLAEVDFVWRGTRIEADDEGKDEAASES